MRLLLSTLIAVTIGSAASAAAQTATPTFNSDIAPILYANCTTCHRPGEVAPFPLLTYDDAAKRARLLATVTEARVMPPWKAEPGHGEFLNERRLSDGDIRLIRAWAAAGAPEGDPSRRPRPPTFPEGWQNGEPDRVVTMPASYTVPADGPDQFRCFVLPLDLVEDIHVSGFEFRPGNPRVVHHAIIYVDSTGAARRRLAASGEDSYRCVGGPGFPATAALGGWAPGADPRRNDPATALPVPKGSDLVVQIHYHPSGKPEEDRSRLGLKLSGPPSRGRAFITLVNRRIHIEPGDANYVVTASMTVPQDVQLVGITPHAHYLAREMKVEAHLPDGTVTPLIWISDWDFNWQGQYFYASPISLPKGTRVSMRYVYDNSESNPRNPSKPPMLVRWGEETNDEMAIAFLEVVLPSPQDVPAFRLAGLLQIIEPFLDAGGRIDDLPTGVGGANLERLRLAFQLFDTDRNGRLDDLERDRLLELVRRLGPP
jgi:hypothetical protein